METETKPKVDTKKVVITLLLVLLTAGTVGGGVYYVLNENFKKERLVSEKALRDIEDRLSKAERNTEDETNEQKSPVTVPSVADITKVDFQPVVEKELYQGRTGIYEPIKAPQYADLNNDGEKEALVSVVSSGTGVCTTGLVYGYKANTLTLLFRKNPPENCHNKFTISGAQIIETFPIYLEGDPNCCPSGGTKTITYGWQGTAIKEISE